MLKKILIGLAVLVVVILAGSAFLAYRYYVVTPPDVAFVSDKVDAQDVDEPQKRLAIDFARLEYEHPLSRQDLMKITPRNLRALSQEQVDQIYARLPAGPIPDGPFAGELFFPRGENRFARVSEILGGGLVGRKVDLATAKVEFFAAQLWKGKFFYRDQKLLRNLIEDRKILEALIPELTDQAVDPDAIERVTVPRVGWLSWILPTRETWLLFPAKLHCGQSLLDARRESIIIDYAYNDDLEDVYIPELDHLVGRKGLRIRDEIRMVRPGFYLGRAYINKVFTLNFTLYNEALAAAETEPWLQGGPIADDCWPDAEQIAAR